MDRVTGVLARLAVLAVAVLVGVVAVPAGPASAASIRSQQWFLDALHIDRAHQVSTGQGVVVAVVDSGVDASHRDLKGHVLKGVSVALKDAGVDSDGWTDKTGHGTAMAGIIAAQGGGADHATGIAPGAKILSVKVSGGSDHSYAEAIRYAVDHDASVINLSVGADNIGASSHPEESAAVRYALGHDVVLVGAAGNTKTDSRITDPANVPGVIAVTGTGRDGKFWSGSVSGRKAVLAAPAQQVVSTYPRTVTPEHTSTPQKTNGYGSGSGTSDSAAIVSGVAALVRAKYPKLDAANVINRLIKTADDKGPAGRDDKYGFGVVDPVQALKADVQPVSKNPLLASSKDSGAASKSAKAEAAGSGTSGGGSAALVIVLVVVLLAVAAFVVLLLVRRRQRRRRAAPPAAAPSGPWVGTPPPRL